MLDVYRYGIVYSLSFHFGQSDAGYILFLFQFSYIDKTILDIYWYGLVYSLSFYFRNKQCRMYIVSGSVFVDRQNDARRISVRISLFCIVSYQVKRCRIYVVEEFVFVYRQNDGRHISVRIDLFCIVSF